MNLITKDFAIGFAACAHRKQVRKYSKEPYVMHPIRVATIVESVTADEDMIIAAILHDVVEDTDVTLTEIREIFGDAVASLVDDLTDVSKPMDGNRDKRRALDRAHTAKASAKAKTIKLADLLDNTADITRHDKDFAITYMREKEQLLAHLREGDLRLLGQAHEAVKAFHESRRVKP